MIEAGKRGFIDLFWPSVLLVEQKSAGKDLFKAGQQADDYVLGLRDRDIPRYVLVCDFQRFRLRHLETGKEVSFTLPELHKNVDEFGFMLGVERRTYGRQAAVNIKAAELLGTLHDALEAKGYRGGDLEKLMVRLLFCLFADDTGIFESKDDFLYLIEERTDVDGGNVGSVLNDLFEILDTPPDERQQGDDPEFDKFPYVNGKLFSGHLRRAVFDAEMRDDLLAAAKFDWGKVSPAIFGSLFQSVMDKEERRKKGAHYTTEPNIMKLIGPLFLDELRAEFEHLKQRRDGGKRAALLAFQEKLGRLQFFDPACGCGNFLVVTYRELRRLEQEALELVFDPNSPMLYEVEALSVLRLDHFHGIELEEFPAHIAEVAMWMTEHLANIELGRTFGKVFADIPLRDSAHIVHGDALEINWNDVLPHEDCFAVMGNPPFAGKKEQSARQKDQVRRIFENSKGSGELDFVACWFALAAHYIGGSQCRTALVATNSITQGEQVAPLWTELLRLSDFRILFAHRTFEWGSDARGKAHVHVIVIGFDRSERPITKRLFEYENQKGEPLQSEAENINPYLVDGSNLLIKKESRPLSPRQEISKGSEATDWGHLTLSKREADELRGKSTINPDWIRPFWGGDEYINGEERFCLWLANANPNELRQSPEIRDRLDAVQLERAKSPKPRTRDLAKYPYAFGEIRQPSEPYLLIPKVSSQRREYVPIGIVDAAVVVSGSAQFIEGPSLFTVGVVTSAMHMAWMRTVGGRTKSDFQYTTTMVYNTFPWPEANDKQKAEIESLTKAVLDAREAWPTSSLADLYDPDIMPANLRKAHAALDAAVDQL
ncbi:class I SAM-dependent DNA methyltransferase [Sphingomonas sp. G124]|uniref:site-specific DNA-methyltransferase (adenine-specific) n=1 Tax=Sphingomonas cremea TaxID=2904799 RepID=A0A9X1QKS6_9SPHN|nr:class I SAM-dependent DNA methyltransferase [Sphingomonas cremea]